ncbi:MAG: chromate transporter [Bacteroidales bacterium]|nr:chromate transporter [Bacteroidales bacterium]
MKVLWQLFSAFFRIGCFTIGGGYAMIPLMQKEIVDNRHWMSEKDFVDMLAVTQSVPGVIAVNSAIYIGYKTKGWKGALAASFACIIPSFVIILLIACFFHQFKDNPYVVKIFAGIRPAVVALIASSVWTIARKMPFSYAALIITTASTLLIWLCKISPVYILIAAAAWGIIYSRFIHPENHSSC